MISDIHDFFSVTLIKKLSSPFFGTFIFCLIVTNYDISLMVFSSASWNEKITYIKSVTENFSIFELKDIYRLLCPIFLALFYVLIWPLIDMSIYKKSNEINYKFREIKKSIEDNAPMTREEEKEFKVRWRKEFEKYETERDRIEKINKDLRDNLKELETKRIEQDVILQKNISRINADENNITELVKHNNSLTKELEDSEKEVIKLRKAINELKIANTENANFLTNNPINPSLALEGEKLMEAFKNVGQENSRQPQENLEELLKNEPKKGN